MKKIINSVLIGLLTIVSLVAHSQQKFSIETETADHKKITIQRFKNKF